MGSKVITFQLRHTWRLGANIREEPSEWCEQRQKALRFTCGRGVVTDTIPLSQSFLLVQQRHQRAQRPPRDLMSKKRAVPVLQKAARLSTLHLPLTCAAWGKPSRSPTLGMGREDRGGVYPTHNHQREFFSPASGIGHVQRVSWAFFFFGPTITWNSYGARLAMSTSFL